MLREVWKWLNESGTKPTTPYVPKTAEYPVRHVFGFGPGNVVNPQRLVFFYDRGGDRSVGVASLFQDESRGWDRIRYTDEKTSSIVFISSLDEAGHERWDIDRVLLTRSHQI